MLRQLLLLTFGCLAAGQICESGCNAPLYNRANPGATVPFCGCRRPFVCYASLGSSSNGVSPGECFVPRPLAVLFAVNGLLALAGIWYTCKTKKGKKLEKANAEGAGMKKKLKAAADAIQTPTFDKIYKFFTVTFPGSPLLFNVAQLVASVYTIVLAIISCCVGPIFVGSGKCTGDYMAYYASEVNNLVLLGIAMTDLSLMTVIFGCVAYFPSFKQFPKRQAILGSMTLVFGAAQFAITHYVSPLPLLYSAPHARSPAPPIPTSHTHP
jgi:hypothetical protein